MPTGNRSDGKFSKSIAAAPVTGTPVLTAGASTATGMPTGMPTAGAATAAGACDARGCVTGVLAYEETGCAIGAYVDATGAACEMATAYRARHVDNASNRKPG